MVRKKLFVCSDLHGFYEETLKALKDAGYDENNDEHLLIVLGDLFDRGENSVQIYEWLFRLQKEGKAIILRGNHEPFLEEYLNGTCLTPFNWLNNGTKETLDDFSHRTASFESWCAIDKQCEMSGDSFVEWLKETRKQINEEYPELISWLENRPNYYETQNYIFTHASIDTMAPDWHIPKKSHYHFYGWDACHWDDGSFLKQPVLNTNGKVVVVGHFGTRELRKKYGLNIEGEDQDSPLYICGKNNKLEKIFIDGCTVLSHKVNVIVLEDELIEGEKNDN